MAKAQAILRLTDEVAAGEPWAIAIAVVMALAVLGLFVLLVRAVFSATPSIEHPRPISMCEQQLPSSVLNKASLRGNEYAWPLGAVEEAVIAAAACGLASLGGQTQFRIPDGTYELYWVSLDSSGRLPKESWKAYVNRSADEVLNHISDVRSRTDFIKEGVSHFPDLHRLQIQGVDLNQFLCFVLYFATKTS